MPSTHLWQVRKVGHAPIRVKANQEYGHPDADYSRPTKGSDRCGNHTGYEFGAWTHRIKDHDAALRTLGAMDCR
jgi:hypothetical protein